MNPLVRTLSICVFTLGLAGAAEANVVRYDLTNVATVIGTSPFITGTGSLLGFFVLNDNGPTPVVNPFIITAVDASTNSVEFEWSSFFPCPGPPCSSSTGAFFDPTTHIWQIFLQTSLGSDHSATLELDWDEDNFHSGAIPLIPSPNGELGTSNWFEIIQHEFAAFGLVRSGSIEVNVPEPASIVLIVIGLVGLLSVSRRT
jgi:hypothetical protein